MSVEVPQEPGGALARLVEEVGVRRLALPPGEYGFVGSDLMAANRVMSRIQAEGLARGPLFCEWGSGLGGVCGPGRKDQAPAGKFSPRRRERRGSRAR